MATRLTPAQRLELEALALDTDRTLNDWLDSQHRHWGSMKVLARLGLVDVLDKQGHVGTFRFFRITKAGRAALTPTGAHDGQH